VNNKSLLDEVTKGLNPKLKDCIHYASLPHSVWATIKAAQYDYDIELSLTVVELK
jgi:hypothetical protein